MFTKVERFISSRNLRPKKKEGFLKVISIFSFLGIMLGVAILIIVMSVMNGFRTDLTNKILGLNPHIIIEPNQNKIKNNFKNYLYKNFKDISIVSSLNGEAVAVTQNNTKGVLVKSLKLQESKNFLFFTNKLAAGNINQFKKGSVLIGSELAYNLGLAVNDQINIISSALVRTPIGGLPKQENFKIAGIFSSGFYEFDSNIIYMTLGDTLSLFEKSQDDISLEIYLENPLMANTLKKKIMKLDKNLFVYSWTDLNKTFFSALKVERNVMFVILTLIIIVAAFNIISGLTILIKNKTREIAILKTLGLSSNSIMKSFFLTGFTIGLLASVAGVFLGTVFSIYIENIRQFLSSILSLEIFPPDVYFLDKMPSELNFTSILIIFLFSLLVTAIASYFPAKLISKMDITKALKYE